MCAYKKLHIKWCFEKKWNLNVLFSFLFEYLYVVIYYEYLECFVDKLNQNFNNFTDSWP